MNEVTSNQLPLRSRGTMEIFDVSINIYKRYFVPIIVWSIVCGLASMAGSVVPGAGLLAFFCAPFLIGSVARCVFGAVQGRNVELRECWEFSRRNYGSILGSYFVSSVVGILLIFAFTLVAVLVLFGVFTALPSLISSTVAAVMGSLLTAVFVIIGSVLLTCLYAWMRMAPLICALEGNGRNSGRFLGRTYELMSGNWTRIFALASLIGLAAIALLFIIGGAVSIVQGVDQLRDILRGQISDKSIMPLLLGYMGTVSIVSILLTPFFYIALAVQYLDLRVRKEAFDIEWAAQAQLAENEIQP